MIQVTKYCCHLENCNHKTPLKIQHLGQSAHSENKAKQKYESNPPYKLKTTYMALHKKRKQADEVITEDRKKFEYAIYNRQ